MFHEIVSCQPAFCESRRVWSLLWPVRAGSGVWERAAWSLE